MSRSAQWLSVVAVMFLTSAITITYAPTAAGTSAPDATPLWVIGAIALGAALFVDTSLARRRIPPLRPAAVETQRILGNVAHEGQSLLGRLNGYEAHDSDVAGEAYWRAAVQAWTEWADGLIHWRLPHLRANFANEAGRDQAAFVGTAWQHHLATWMHVRMERLNEFTLNAPSLQHELGPKPTDAAVAVPDWANAPDSAARR